MTRRNHASSCGAAAATVGQACVDFRPVDRGDAVLELMGLGKMRKEEERKRRETN